jgi:hypothetical protein
MGLCDSSPSTPPSSGSGSSGTGSSSSCGSGTNICGGTSKYSDDKVEVKTGASYGSSYTDGISIKVKCAKDPHVVQFIYREIIGADGKPIERTMTTTGGTYKTTTDPSKPNWNTDSASKPNPYYDGGGAAESDSSGLTTFDQPFLTPGTGETWRATFKAYTICDGKVQKEVTWVRSQKEGESPKYDVSVKDASELPDWAKKQMKDNGYNEVP